MAARVGPSARPGATSIGPTSTRSATPGCCSSPFRSSAGGLWEGLASARPVCEIYRNLAGADPSVALVSVDAPRGHRASGSSAPTTRTSPGQRSAAAVFASALAGDQWGTITSEPGSGGDIARTKAVAAPVDGEPFLAGDAVRHHRRQALRQRLGHLPTA